MNGFFGNRKMQTFNHQIDILVKEPEVAHHLNKKDDFRLNAQQKRLFSKHI
jgi:hypothetical protein